MRRFRLLIVPLLVVAAAFIGAGPASASTTRAAIPAIKAGGCNGGTRTWAHVYLDSGAVTCVGFKGNYSPNAWAYAFCAGNNRGYIVGFDEFNNNIRVNYQPGDRFSFANFPGGDFFIDGVNIQGWSGNATCP